MLNSIAMQIIQSQGDIKRDIHLKMIRKIPLPTLQEVSEALLHQLHEKDWPTSTARSRVLQDTQELDDAWMLQLTQDSTLLFEALNEIFNMRII